MNKSILSLGCMALLMAFTFISCKKDSRPEVDSDNMESAENNALAEANYNDVTILLDAAASFGTNMSFRTTEEQSIVSGCVTVSIDTVSVPRNITIDFGTANCLNIDGRNRRGKIIASYTGRYKDSGTVINISFDNYFVNDHQIKGTKTITNKGKNQAGSIVYLVAVNGQLVKPANGGTITWISTRTREWTAGYNTPLNILDDAYSITGTANGTNASGHAYAITITSPLVRKMSCRWFESGQVTVVPEGMNGIVLDYGSTGCDANATIMINNKSYAIVLQ